MKKLFVCALAASMFTACSQDETISQQSPMQISFDGAFVENATRAVANPAITTDNIQNFDVWAFMDNATGVVFNDEDVTKVEGSWKTTTVQYWAPNHTYYFGALSPMNSVNVEHQNFVTGNQTDGQDWTIGLIDYTNVDGTEDLLYATKTVTTGSQISEDNPGKVEMVFNHLLSKVKFSFTNSFSNPNAYIKITNIKMSVPTKAKINLNQPFENLQTTNHWAIQGEDKISLAFGDMQIEKMASNASSESAYERLTIPTENVDYLVTFDVELYYGEVKAYANTLKTTIADVALEMGKAYNFHAEINAENIVPGDDKLYPIEFNASVIEWDEYETVEDPDGMETESFPILTTEDAKVAAGGIKTLQSSHIVETTCNVAGTLDGNGYTLYPALEATNNALVSPEGTATIKNLTIDGGNKYTKTKSNLRAIYITKPGNYTFDNVKFIGNGYALNISLKSGDTTLNVSNSTFEGWTSYSSCVTATFTNVNFTCGTYELLGKDAPYHKGYFRPYGQTELNGCKFEVGYKIDMGSLGTGKTIKFIDCYYGSEKITASNIETLAFIDNYDATKIEF